MQVSSKINQEISGKIKNTEIGSFCSYEILLQDSTYFQYFLIIFIPI